MRRKLHGVPESAQNVGSGSNDGVLPGCPDPSVGSSEPAGGFDAAGEPGSSDDGADWIGDALGSTGGDVSPTGSDPAGDSDPAGGSDSPGGSSFWTGIAAAAAGTPRPPDDTTNDKPAKARTRTPAISERLARSPAGTVQRMSIRPLIA